MTQNFSHAFDEEVCIQGAPISQGIAIGKPFFIASFDEEEIHPKVSISQDNVELEIERYRNALSSSRTDLQELHEKLSREGSDEATHIIDTHIQMLSDPLLTTHMEEMIRINKQNTEAVFHAVISDYREKLGRVKERLFQERVIDVIDLSQRVLNHLRPRRGDRLSNVPPNSVVFAKEIAPSETAAVGASRVSAFVTQEGGGSSHAALIARSKGIPFVASIDIQQFKGALASYVIVNGLTGDVIINPTEETLEKYRAIQHLLEEESEGLTKEVALDSETRDGKKVALHANIASVSELEKAAHNGAGGIGLFRTEFLLADDDTLILSEERQYSIYREVFDKGGDIPIVMRLFDVGGDKFPHLVSQREGTSVSTLRGIRFLLRHKELFKKQLRALLRADRKGAMRLLLPLVSEVSEVQKTRELLHEVQSELRTESIETQMPPLGSLIEVPAAVMIAEELAKESDFISLGTNDLIQFVLGLERNQMEVSSSFLPAHPTIIQMIQRVITVAHAHNRTVTLCGELASNPHFIPLLIGLGVDIFSCPPRYIPIVKRVVRQSECTQAQHLAHAVLHCDTPEEITKRLKDHYAFLADT